MAGHRPPLCGYCESMLGQAVAELLEGCSSEVPPQVVKQLREAGEAVRMLCTTFHSAATSQAA